MSELAREPSPARGHDDASPPHRRGRLAETTVQCRKFVFCVVSEGSFQAYCAGNSYTCLLFYNDYQTEGATSGAQQLDTPTVEARAKTARHMDAQR